MTYEIREQTRGARCATRMVLAALTMLVAAAGAGCGDEGGEAAKQKEVPIVGAVEGETAWLGLADEDLPEEWLVRRKTKAGAPVDQARVDAARTLLAAAAKSFGDQPRMIANRAAQLEEMLAEKGYAEDATLLIETLMRVAGGSRPTGGFASLCQYYFNLRAQGLDRDQAIDALAKIYGSDA